MLPVALATATASRSLVLTSARAVSSKYPKPKPRPYKRRLFEAALEPVLPKQLKTCYSPIQGYNNAIEEAKQYMPVELALVNLVKKWLSNEEYRVMAICQFLPVPGRTLWFAKNQLRLKDLEFRTYGNKIMRKVLEGTPLSPLEVTLTGTNAILVGKDLSALKTIVNETDKLNWIVPIAFVADSRILSVSDVHKLTELASMEDLRAHTVQILSTQLGALPMSLDSQSQQLVNSLSHLAQPNPSD